MRPQKSLNATLIQERAHIEALDPSSLGGIQRAEEKVSLAVMTMESNVTVMIRLQGFYRDLLRDEDFPNKHRRICLLHAKSFASQLEDIISEIQIQIIRAKTLSKIVSDRKLVVRSRIFSSLLREGWRKAWLISLFIAAHSTSTGADGADIVEAYCNYVRPNRP